MAFVMFILDEFLNMPNKTKALQWTAGEHIGFTSGSLARRH